MLDEQEIKARTIAKCEGRKHMLEELIIEMQGNGRKTIKLEELIAKHREEEGRVNTARENYNN